MKKYHWWWLIATTVSVFIGANYVMFALTGLMLIEPATFGQGVMQFFVFLCSVCASLFGIETGSHMRKQ